MAQATILATGTSVATSSTVSIAAGETAGIGVFVDAGETLPSNFPVFWIFQTTPGADLIIGSLNKGLPSKVIVGPGTFKVRRPLITGTGTGIGVFSDT